MDSTVLLCILVYVQCFTPKFNDRYVFNILVLCAFHGYYVRDELNCEFNVVLKFKTSFGLDVSWSVARNLQSWLCFPLLTYHQRRVKTTVWILFGYKTSVQKYVFSPIIPIIIKFCLFELGKSCSFSAILGKFLVLKPETRT